MFIQIIMVNCAFIQIKSVWIDR